MLQKLFVLIVVLGVCTAAVVEVIGKPSILLNPENDALVAERTQRQFGFGGHGGYGSVGAVFGGGYGGYGGYNSPYIGIGGYGPSWTGGHGGYGGFVRPHGGGGYGHLG